MHNPVETVDVRRTQEDDSRLLVTCLFSLRDYNKYMGGVDYFDQLRSRYNIWKNRRWWMRIFYYLVESYIVNSFIGYKTNPSAEAS